jgi:hypothetical protein
MAWHKFTNADFDLEFAETFGPGVFQPMQDCPVDDTTTTELPLYDLFSANFEDLSHPKGPTFERFNTASTLEPYAGPPNPQTDPISHTLNGERSEIPKQPFHSVSMEKDPGPNRGTWARKHFEGQDALDPYNDMRQLLLKPPLQKKVQSDKEVRLSNVLQSSCTVCLRNSCRCEDSAMHEIGIQLHSIQREEDRRLLQSGGRR